MRLNRSGYTAGARVRHRLWCRRRLGVLEPETARRWRCSFEFVPIPSSSIAVTLSGSEAGLRVIQFTKRHWSFTLAYTHHGFRADATEVSGELERIIDQVRAAHPEALVD